MGNRTRRPDMLVKWRKGRIMRDAVGDLELTDRSRACCTRCCRTCDASSTRPQHPKSCYELFPVERVAPVAMGHNRSPALQ